MQIFRIAGIDIKPHGNRFLVRSVVERIGMHPAERGGQALASCLVLFRLIQPSSSCKQPQDILFLHGRATLLMSVAVRSAGGENWLGNIPSSHIIVIQILIPNSAPYHFLPLSSRKAVIEGSKACHLPCGFGLCCHSLPNPA